MRFIRLLARLVGAEPKTRVKPGRVIFSSSGTLPDATTLRLAARDVYRADQEYETALARYLVACDRRDAAVAALGKLTDPAVVEV